MSVPSDPAPEPKAPDTATRAAAVEVDPAVVAERVGSRVVVVHLETNQIHELNATAGRVLELLRSGADRRAILATLLAEFDVDASSAERALDQVLVELRERRITR